jgi:hypothetical protein
MTVTNTTAAPLNYLYGNRNGASRPTTLLDAGFTFADLADLNNAGHETAYYMGSLAPGQSAQDAGGPEQTAWEPTLSPA